MLARHAVRELMNGCHDQDEREERQDRRRLIQPWQVAGDLASVRECDREREQNGDGRQHQEPPSEQKPQTGNEPPEQPVGVEEGKSQVQQTTANLRAAAGIPLRRRFAGVEQTDLVEVLDERFQCVGAQRRAEPLFGSLADDVERGFTIELLGDEPFGLAEPVESAGDGMFDNEKASVGRLQPANGQIAPKSGCGGNHGGFRPPPIRGKTTRRPSYPGRPMAAATSSSWIRSWSRGSCSPFRYSSYTCCPNHDSCCHHCPSSRCHHHPSVRPTSRCVPRASRARDSGASYIPPAGVNSHFPEG